MPHGRPKVPGCAECKHKKRRCTDVAQSPPPAEPELTSPPRESRAPERFDDDQRYRTARTGRRALDGERRPSPSRTTPSKSTRRQSSSRLPRRPLRSPRRCRITPARLHARLSARSHMPARPLASPPARWHARLPVCPPAHPLACTSARRDRLAGAGSHPRARGEKRLSSKPSSPLQSARP